MLARKQDVIPVLTVSKPDTRLLRQSRLAIGNARKLEIQLQTKLKHARVAGGGDDAEAGGAGDGCGDSEWWRVGDVEGFGAELDVAMFAEGGALDERDVGVAILWTTHRLRELLPIVNCGAIVNADVSKKRAVVRSDDGRFGSLTRFGRCVPKPANALKFVA